MVQSLIAVQPVTISPDKQALQDDPQQLAARIAARLRQAGYLHSSRKPAVPFIPLLAAEIATERLTLGAKRLHGA